jgi:hypothetical protein
MSATNTAAANRRGSRRLPSRNKVRVTCRKGDMDLGPNLAVSLLDASQTGVRLALKTPLDMGQIVSLTLDAPSGSRPARGVGKIVWAVPAADGTCLVGVRLHKPLTYNELALLASL